LSARRLSPVEVFSLIILFCCVPIDRFPSAPKKVQRFFKNSGPFSDNSWHLDRYQRHPSHRIGQARSSKEGRKMKKFLALGTLTTLACTLSLYLVARPAEQRWDLFGGQGVGWPGQKYYNVRSMAVAGNILYVGLTAYAHDGGAAVYEYQDGRWSQIGGDGQPWEASNGSVTDLQMYQGDLYAAIGYGDAQVWRRHAGCWELVAGKGVRQSWSAGSHEWAYCLEVHNGLLYVGLKNHSEEKIGRADVYVFDGANWHQIGNWSDHAGVYDLCSWNGDLYAGLHGLAESGPRYAAQVWKYRGGTEWELVGGNGVNGSWNAADASHCLCLTQHEGKLIATLGRAVTEPIHPVWKFDGAQWTTVGQAPAAWEQMHIFNYAISHEGHLYVGAGGRPKNVATLWRLDGDHYTQVGGEKTFGSWPAPVIPGAKATEWIYRMIEFQNALLIGIAGGEDGQAQVWRQLPMPGAQPVAISHRPDATDDPTP
jgi:hypothetical protein